MIGTTLQSRYRIEAELGHGGMGAVYRAHDTLLDRDVAIKVLTAPAGSDVRERWLREAQSTARLNHPNIVAVHDAGEADGTPFIVMELIEGESLFNRKPQSLDEILSIARQICAALDHAHSHGIVHRDLKPENVLITPDGTAKLMDFGLARSATSRLTQEGALVGTVFYLSPEQALGQTVDGRTDLYALGVMLYEMTTGQLPFTGDNPLTIIAQHIHSPVAPPHTLRTDLPPALEAIMLKLLSKDPADRFASAREAAQALAGQIAVEPGPRTFAPRNNLPSQLSSFIGREREIAEVKRLLSPLSREAARERGPGVGSRLVTLTGTGGSGKTRLALQVAAELLPSFPEGVWLVELAFISDPALVPQAVASALEIREQSDRRVLESLSDHLRARRALIVLDNCEHVIAACAQLAERLLHHCSNLQILATSREVLGITGETAWPVPPLSVPDLRTLATLDDHVSALSQYESVQLFVERTAAVQPTFAVTDQNALTVAQVCARLDGIPLAIELAAARMRVLSIEQIAARLDDRLNLLTLGSRTALPRHQTLRAAFDWSYDLLPAAERVLLNRLAVLAGGWTLEAAESVTGESPLATSDVLDALTQLVNKSLVVMEQTQGRYRLLETIRQYALEKLGSSGEIEKTQARHLEFFLKLAEQAEPELRRADQVRWLDRLEVEHDNSRAALSYALEQGKVEASLRLASSLSRFWYLRGHWSEGREWLERTLAQPATGAALVRATALQGLAWLANETGKEKSLYEESLALCRGAGAEGRWNLAFSLRGLGVWTAYWGDDAQAESLLNESQGVFRELGDPWGIALVLFNLGWLAAYSIEQSEAVWQEGLSLFRTVGDRWGMAVTLGGLGYVARLRNDYQKAINYSKESLSLFRELGDKAGVAMSLSRLGQVAYRRDDYKHMTQLFEESLAIEKELGYKTDQAYSLLMLGRAACFQGDYERATRLLKDSLARFQQVEEKDGMAATLDFLAIVAHYQSNDEQAVALWEQSLSLSRESKEKGNLALALIGLGHVASHQGDYSRAKELVEQGLALFQEIGDKQNIAFALNSLGRVVCAQGDHERAATLFKESLATRRELGTKRGIAESLEGVAGVALAQGDYARVAKLLGMADAIRESIGAPLPPVERAEHNRRLEAARAQLGEPGSTSAWAKGRAMTLEQTIGFALEENE